MTILEIEAKPSDKKAFMDKLTAQGFKFTTKPKSKQVCIEVSADFETEDFSQLDKFFALQDENL